MRNWLLLALLVLPTAAAHGAPAAREFDVRLLQDTTSSGDYGGPGGALDAGGLDLLALDVFEGNLPGSAEPAIVFRIIVQGGAPGEHRIELTLAAGGTQHTLTLESRDLATYSSTSFEAVRGPYDVGDGHPKAIEGVVRHAALGIQPGAELTGIQARSILGGEVQDTMPGSWYVMGQEVPLPPNETPGGPASHRTGAPAPLFTAAANRSLVPVGSASVRLTFNSSLQHLDQVLSLSVQAPAGIDASLSDTTVVLDAGGSGEVVLRVEGVALGTVRVLAESDLGAARLLSLPLDGAGMIGNGANVDSKDLLPGDSFQYTFTHPGAFTYHCHPHPWMMGTILIAEPVNGTPPRSHVVRLVEPSSSSSDWRFDPKELTIHAGDTVIWVNEGATVHTVMGSTGTSGHDDHDHDHGHDAPKKGSPSPLALLPLALAAWLFVRRRSA